MVRYAWYGEPWFLAGDVCRVLGIKNSSKAVSDIETKFKTAGLKGIYSSYTLLETAGAKDVGIADTLIQTSAPATRSGI